MAQNKPAHTTKVYHSTILMRTTIVANRMNPQLPHVFLFQD